MVGNRAGAASQNLFTSLRGIGYSALQKPTTKHYADAQNFLTEGISNEVTGGAAVFKKSSSSST